MEKIYPKKNQKMNYEQRQRQLRLMQQYRSTKHVDLIDEFEINEDGQIQQSMANKAIVIESDDEVQPTLQIKNTKQETQKAKKQIQQKQIINVRDTSIQPKLNLEDADEEIQPPPREQSVQQKQKEKPVQQPKQKEIDHMQVIANKVRQLSTIPLPAVPEPINLTNLDEEPKPQAQQTEQRDYYGISYDEFELMKKIEKATSLLQKQKEEERKAMLLQKQQKKDATVTKKHDETQQQYQERMLELMQKQIKNTQKKIKKGSNEVQNQQNLQISKRKKPPRLEEFTEEQLVDDVIKLINGEKLPDLSNEVILGPQIRPAAQMINYDVLLKNGKILKQALQKPPESDKNPMVDLYKGRYASEFIFNGGIDFDDGPYGMKPRKKVKLPFPKHKLTLQPWEYYGVSPDEYFATKNPNFEFKKKYINTQEYYNELPRPKADPRYYQYDVESLLSKRYSEKHEEIQYQTQYVGYQKKHWTPINHLKIKCPKAVLEYELYERDRLFCEILNVKLKKVKISHKYCILRHKVVSGRREPATVLYLKGSENEDLQRQKQTIQNEEAPKQPQPSQYFDEPDDLEEMERKRISKEQKMLEDDWDPKNDDTIRSQRAKQRKEKMEKQKQEEEQRKQEKQKGRGIKQSNPKNQKKEAKNKQKLREEVNQFEDQLEQEQQQQFQSEFDRYMQNQEKMQEEIYQPSEREQIRQSDDSLDEEDKIYNQKRAQLKRVKEYQPIDIQVDIPTSLKELQFDKDNRNLNGNDRYRKFQSQN